MEERQAHKHARTLHPVTLYQDVGSNQMSENRNNLPDPQGYTQV